MRNIWSIRWDLCLVQYYQAEENMEKKLSFSKSDGIPIKQKKEEGWCIFLVIYVALTQKSKVQA